jgi:hypothetical protein
VPGEGIVFNVNIDNKSGRQITEMTVKLVQSIRFHATHKSKTCNRVVAAVRYPGKVAARTIYSWKNAVLLIPPVCSSSNGTCRIIEVSYVTVLTLETSGIAISKDIKVPLAIGTIPIRMPIESTTDEKSDDLDSASYYTLTVPSYEACMFGMNRGSDMPNDFDSGKGEFVESDETTYKPHYPYYKDL